MKAKRGGIVSAARAGVLGGAVLLAAAGVAQARVFWRWGAAAEGEKALESAGGRSIYTAPVAVNGGSGRLTVFSFAAPLGDVLGSLRQVYSGLAVRGDGSGTMATASLAADGHVLRLAILQLAAGPGTLVLQLDQTQREFEASRAAPARHPLTALPEYPAAEPSFFARDDHAGMSLAVAVAAASARDVQGFYSDRLTGEGWEPALKSAGGATVALGMDLYQRGRETCCVFADATPNGGTRITLLHKQPGVE